MRITYQTAAHSYGYLRIFVKHNGWHASYVERTGLPARLHILFSSFGFRLHFVSYYDILGDSDNKIALLITMATKQQSVMEELEESSRTQSSHVPPVRVLSGNSDFSSPGPPSLSSAASPSHLPLPACPVRGILAQTTKQTPASDPQKSAVHSFQSLPHLLPSATKTEK